MIKVLDKWDVWVCFLYVPYTWLSILIFLEEGEGFHWGWLGEGVGGGNKGTSSTKTAAWASREKKFVSCRQTEHCVLMRGSIVSSANMMEMESEHTTLWGFSTRVPPPFLSLRPFPLPLPLQCVIDSLIRLWLWWTFPMEQNFIN